jgi:hypothetical protein
MMPFVWKLDEWMLRAMDPWTTKFLLQFFGFSCLDQDDGCIFFLLLGHLN